MIVRLFTLNKRENSTLRPTGTGTEFNCVLKEDTSMISPSIIINFADQSNPQPHIFNYAYIPDFGRYYFVADQKSMRGLHWEYSLVCDVLATYKTEIGNFSAYVLRSAHAYNGKVSDNFYPGISQYSIDGQSSVDYQGTARASTPWRQTISGGCFVLGMQSQNGSMGSIKYIALDPANMQTLCAKLATDTVTAANGFQDIISSIGTAMTKQLVDPLQYIKSAQWFPVPYSTFSSLPAETSLDTGYFSFTNVSYKDITTMLFWGSLLAFPVNNHPQISRGTYLNNQPYTDRYLFAPPFGIVPINNANIQDFSYIAVNYRVDFVTGQADLTMYGTNDPQLNNVHLAENLIGRASGQVGLSVTMTQAVSDYIGMVTGTAQALTGAVLMSPDMMGAGLFNTLNAKMPRLSSVGGTGGMAGIAGTWRVYSVFNHIAAEHLEDVGRPLCEVRTINTLPGYNVCRHGDVAISGTSGEQQKVRAYLEEGFFYE